jgi:hypothetical protein
MAFPHKLVTRGAWLASGVVLVLVIARRLESDGRQPVPRVDVPSPPAAVRAPRPTRAVVSAGDRVAAEDIILSLTRVGNGENRVEGFTLKRPMHVRVLALGEALGGQLYDYGAILDAKTRKTVWAMDLAHTEHAGGADKNRMEDEVVSLDPGSYLVYYVTDDSHSYDDWNSAEPDYPALWGITLISEDGPVDRKVVLPYDDGENDAVLARIVGVGDDADLERRFTLDRTSDVRVYAIGEGDDDEMYDYAWIEDARTGHVVWRMTYGDTEHAGGAQKNRLFDRTVHLPAGEYRVRYQSDDSHSFGDWNEDAPRDPFSYGVTVFRQ